MTKEQLKKRLPVIAAWCDGKKIEWRYIDRNVIHNQPWLLVMDEEPDFLNNTYNHQREYRIKPKRK